MADHMLSNPLAYGLAFGAALLWPCYSLAARRWGGGHNAVDRKSTRLNSSHLVISYAVFCLKKKKKLSVHLSEIQIANHMTKTNMILRQCAAAHTSVSAVGA